LTQEEEEMTQEQLLSVFQTLKTSKVDEKTLEFVDLLQSSVRGEKK
jgi:hypothetical protein